MSILGNKLILKKAKYMQRIDNGDWQCASIEGGVLR